MTDLKQLIAWLDQTLEIERTRDFAENGLQVEGKPQVAKIVTGVSANLALIEAAVAKQADLLVVHHGLVWGGIRRIQGPLRQRLALLLQHNISLAAYHLPLDKHPTLGNNAGLSKEFGLVEVEPFGDYKGQIIGCLGVLPKAQDLQAVVAKVKTDIHPQPIVFKGNDRMVSRVAICSGDAPDLIEEAIEKGCDLFISGELTEYVPALAVEGKINVIAAGHHATERYGVKSLAQVLGEQFQCDCEFVEIPNPL